MNVTKTNFSFALKEIESLLPSASFIAFDEEMTGISLSDPFWSVTQTPSERYQSMKNVANTYRIIQFGICLFHKEGDEYRARPYNFFAFPATGMITMDGESTSFNKRHKMDFNKWIYEGIPYLSAHEQDYLKQTLFPSPEKQERKRNSSGGSSGSSGGVTLRTPQDKEFVAKVMEDMIKWSELTRPQEEEGKKEEETSHGDAATHMPTHTHTHTLSDYQTFHIPPSNSFLRLALRRNVENLFPHFFFETIDTEDKFKKNCVVLRLSPEEKKKRDEEKDAEKQKMYEDQLGLRRLFQALVSSQLPLIGHNCMYDLMFMLCAFDSLPVSLIDFKFALSHSFPTIYDTKFLASVYAEKFFSSTASTVIQTSSTSSTTVIDDTVSATAPSSPSSSSSSSSAPWAVDSISISEASSPPLSTISSSASPSPSSSFSHETPSSAQNTTTTSLSSSSSLSSASLPPPPPPPPFLPPRFKHTSLEEVFNTLQFQGDFKVRLADGFTRYAETGAAHEAGFDAYMTGCVFSRFSHPTEEMKNMIMLANTFYHLNLRGADKLVEEDKVIYHCAFNTQWVVSEVQTLFQEAGEIRTKFIDGRSCVVWVDVSRQEQADALTKIHTRKNAGIPPAGSFEVKTGTVAPDQRKVIVRAWAAHLRTRESDYKSEGEEEAESGEGDEADEEEDERDEDQAGKRIREEDTNPFAALQQKRRKIPSVESN